MYNRLITIHKSTIIDKVRYSLPKLWNKKLKNYTADFKKLNNKSESCYRLKIVRKYKTYDNALQYSAIIKK